MLRIILLLLDDVEFEKRWFGLFDFNFVYWSWGLIVGNSSDGWKEDLYVGCGILMCGFLDVLLDYINKFNNCIVCFVVIKF